MCYNYYGFKVLDLDVIADEVILVYDKKMLKGAKPLSVIRPERELSDEYIKECLEKELKSVIRAFILIVFVFLFSVWVILSVVIFLCLGAWGFLPFFIGGTMFAVFFWFLYPEYRKAKRNLAVLDCAILIKERIVCEEKICLSGSDTLDSENDKEYYIRCARDRYFSLGTRVDDYDLVRRGEELLFAGIEPEDYIVAFADYSD